MFSSLVTIELDVEYKDECYTYVGEWEDGKQHFYSVKDDYGNDLYYDNPAEVEIADLCEAAIQGSITEEEGVYKLNNLN